MNRASSIVFLFLGVTATCSSKKATPEPPSIAQEPLKEPTEFAPGCAHPAVSQNCADGWCRIPAGCFLQGSPETEPDRARYGEKLTAVTITRPFIIQQHEVTQAEWLRFGKTKTGISVDPSAGVSLDDCLEDNCPASAVNLVEAMAYANYLSENNTPPLRPCFKLVNCRGPVSGVITYPLSSNLDEIRMACEDFTVDAASIFECEGFRLPTESEWEYTARAGSRTAYYLGDHIKNPDPLERTTYDEKALSPAAWYDWNSGNRSHPVMLKVANAWGLYDMLGNMSEVTYSRWETSDYSGAVVDPVRVPSQPSGDSVVSRGGLANGSAGMLRAANRFATESSDSLGIGFRLVRTLKDGETWPPASK